MIRHKDGWPFDRPITKADAPDYHKIIDKPMDLGTIRSNINRMKYSCNQVSIWWSLSFVVLTRQIYVTLCNNLRLEYLIKMIMTLENFGLIGEGWNVNLGSAISNGRDQQVIRAKFSTLS